MKINPWKIVPQKTASQKIAPNPNPKPNCGATLRSPKKIAVEKNLAESKHR